MEEHTKVCAVVYSGNVITKTKTDVGLFSTILADNCCLVSSVWPVVCCFRQDNDLTTSDNFSPSSPKLTIMTSTGTLSFSMSDLILASFVWSLALSFAVIKYKQLCWCTLLYRNSFVDVLCYIETALSMYVLCYI